MRPKSVSIETEARILAVLGRSCPGKWCIEEWLQEASGGETGERRYWLEVTEEVFPEPVVYEIVLGPRGPASDRLGSIMGVMYADRG